MPYWTLGLALGLTCVSHGLSQNREEGSGPTLPLSDLPWHCKIPQVKPCSRCRSPSNEWHLAEPNGTGLLRLHRYYSAKHFMLNVALTARQNRELLYITRRHGAAHLPLFLLWHCYKSNPFVRRDLEAINRRI